MTTCSFFMLKVCTFIHNFQKVNEQWRWKIPSISTKWII